MKKLTLILAMLLSNVANAATFASAIVPYNGTYNNQTTTSCDLDSSYATPLSLTTAVDNVTTGQEIFTPDITHTSTVSSLDAFKTKWVPYVTGLTTFSPVITNPIPLLTATPDPTAPLVMLNETPIQWGTYSIQGFGADLTQPTTSVGNGMGIFAKSGYLFITSFTYKPAPSTNVKTGYAAYVWLPNTGNNGTWMRHVAFTSTYTNTTASSNIVSMRAFSKQYTIGASPYNYNCVGKGIHIR